MPVASPEKIKRAGQQSRVPQPEQISGEAQQNRERLIQRAEIQRQQSLIPEERERQVQQQLEPFTQQLQQQARKQGVDLPKREARRIALENIQVPDPTFPVGGQTPDPQAIRQRQQARRAQEAITGTRERPGVSEPAGERLEQFEPQTQIGEARQLGRGLARTLGRVPGVGEILQQTTEQVTEGLFGTGRTGRDIRTGELRTDEGLIGFIRNFAPFGTPKTTQQRIINRQQALEEQGLSRAEAQQKATLAVQAGTPSFTDIQIDDEGRPQINFNQEQAQETLNQLGVSEEEQKALRFEDVLDTVDRSLGALDFIGLGVASRAGRSTFQRIARTTSRDSIQKILKSEFPEFSGEGRRVLAEGLRVIDDADDVQRVINRAQFQLRAPSAVSDDALEQLPNRQQIENSTGRDIVKKAERSPDVDDFTRSLTRTEQSRLDDTGLDPEDVFNRAQQTRRTQDVASQQENQQIDQLSDQQIAQQFDIPEETAPFAREVRKFDSAEEFVKRDIDLLGTPNVWERPDILRQAVKTKEGAKKTRQGFIKQRAKAQENIEAAGGIENAATRDIIADKDAKRTLKAIAEIEDDLPTQDELTDLFNKVKQAEGQIQPDQQNPGSLVAQQRAGERIVTPEGRRFQETQKDAVREQGFSDIREIEDIMKTPVKTGNTTPSLRQAMKNEGMDPATTRFGTTPVTDIAGVHKFDLETAKDIRGGNTDLPDGVATRILQDGETHRPAVRKSGVFAEKEFAEHEFVDATGFLGGQSFNLRDLAFTVDNITAQQAADRGSWGPMVYMQYAVRQADATKDAWGAERSQMIRNILQERGIKLNKKNGRQVTLALWGVDNQKLRAGQVDEAIEEVMKKIEISEKAKKKIRGKLKRAAKGGISDNVMEVAQRDIRAQLDELRDEANIVRRELGKTEIGFVEDYGPLMQRQSFWNQMRADPRTEITDNFDFVIPNAKKNPHAVPREGGLDDVNIDAFETLGRYIDNISNDIFIAPQIEKLKAVREVLKGRGLPGASRAIDSIIRQNIVGQPGPIDSLLGFRKGTKKSIALNKFVQARSAAALGGNIVWTVFVQPASLAMLTLPRLGGRGITGSFRAAGSLFGGLVDFIGKSKVRTRIKNRPVIASKTRGASVGMSGAGDLDKMAGKIQRGKIETYNDFINKLADANEYWLTGSSVSAGYREAEKLGLKGRDADVFADWIGGATQSEYNRLGRPLFLNNQTVRAVFPFQTFAFEFYRYVKTLLGAKGGLPLEKSKRVNQIILLIAGAYLYNQYSEATTGRKLTTPGSAIPLVGGEVDRLVDQSKGALGFSTNQQRGFGRSPVAPFEDVRRFIGASDAYVNDNNIQPLRKELTRWGMGFSNMHGAATVGRFVDGMVANVKGAQLTKGGNFAFPVTGSDKWIAPILGPYSTQAGKQYLNERRKKEKQKASVRPVYDQAQEMLEQGKDEQAQALVDSLSKKEWQTYQNIKQAERARKTEDLKVEILPKFQKAQQLKEEGKRDEAQKIVDNLTEEEWNAYQKLKDQNEKFEQAQAGNIPTFGDGDLTTDDNIIELVTVYADAVGTDPISAFQTMFTSEQLRKVENDTVIFERAPLQETQEIRRELADDVSQLDQMRLDHSVPLQLGGDNSKDNLELVPVQLWESYTPVENHLGRLLRDSKISGEEARELITDFKEGRIDADEIMQR